MSRRAGKWERIAVRLNAILRKVPKERSLDGKTWHAETSARRSLMRYIVGVVARLIEEEDERARAAETSDGGADVRPTRITLAGQTVDLKPGETLDIHVKPMDTRTIPVERVILAADASSCGWCGKILPASGECPCLPF